MGLADRIEVRGPDLKGVVKERGWPTSVVSLDLGYRTHSAEMLPGPVQAASTMSRIGFLVGREKGRRALPLGLV